MNNIGATLRRGEYDFVWSACALEHLGSIRLGMEFVMNSLDCLNKGGVAVHTTEYNVESNDETVESGGTVLYRKSDIQSLAEAARRKGFRISIDFSPGHSPLDRYYDMPPYRPDHHLKLLVDNFVTTSIALVFYKLD